MLRNVMLAAALAALVPVAAHAAPLRNAAPTGHAEAARGGGVWIGALVFLLAAAAVLGGYASSNSGPPASP